MRQRKLIIGALAAISLGLGCATNPARRLEANEQDIEITPNGSFIRGDEHLDEEEFYALAGDQKSADEIHAERAQGEMFQPVGIATGVVGALVGVGGFAYYYQSTNKPIVGEGTDFYIGYALMGLGALGAVGGGYLWFDGNEKASGKNRHFDEKHALASLEGARYGSGGATQSTVASVELATASGAASFCSIGDTPLKTLVAKDAKGRAIKLDATRTSWFVWNASPSLDVLTGDKGAVISPYEASLATLGQNVIIDVKVDAPTGVATQLVLKPDYGCPRPSYGFGGEGGASGTFGESGMSAGSEGQSGGGGGQGGPGGQGARGHDVEVEATAIANPIGGGELIAATIGERGSSRTFIAVFDPKTAGPLTVFADGGAGGQGGNGGHGGNGWSFGSGDSCRAGGAGGNGGSGGPGGNGGDGGNVRIRATDAHVLAALQASVSGGPGGSAGFSGSGGSGGDGDSCGSDRAARGPDGVSGAGGGASGNSGRPGKIDASVAPRTALRSLNEALGALGKGPPTQVIANAPAAAAAPGSGAAGSGAKAAKSKKAKKAHR